MTSNVNRNCALFVREDASAPFIAAAPALDPSSRIGATMHIIRGGNATNPWSGFRLLFPLGSEQRANENNGFGVRHFCTFTT